MESGFNVDLNELRGHATTVSDVAGQVHSAAAGPQNSVGGAFGQIAEFFASGVTAAGDELRGVISQAGDTVTDVQAGLRETADSYQNTDDHYATVFGGQQFAQVQTEGSPTTAGVGSVNGRYGDDHTGPIGTALDVAKLMTAPSLPERVIRLNRVESGIIVPDPDSRLGAFAGTHGYPRGTVGNAVHLGIAAIYMYLGDAGQENIGRVFNSPEARALYSQPIDSAANLEIARIEYEYWSNVHKEDPWSMGANMATQLSPEVRAAAQSLISGTVPPVPPPVLAPPVRITPPYGHDGG